jgi:hypothetical protein
MTTSTVSKKLRVTLRPAMLVALAAALAACSGGGAVLPAPAAGGGGAGASASPYTLFASNYVRYPAQTNGAYLHTIQGGDVYAVTIGNWGFGCYDSDQPTINAAQIYLWQGQANGNGSCGALNGNAAPTTAGDIMLLSIKAPGSPGGGAPVPFDISQAGTLLIQMGNNRAPDSSATPARGGHADHFTVQLNNDASVAGDNSQATAICQYVQQLDGTGTGASNYPAGPPHEFSVQGTRNYAIALTSFTCSGAAPLKGDLPTLKASGITKFTVLVTGDQNPNVLQGEFDSIIIGTIGFTK